MLDAICTLPHDETPTHRVLATWTEAQRLQEEMGTTLDVLYGSDTGYRAEERFGHCQSDLTDSIEQACQDAVASTRHVDRAKCRIARKLLAYL